MTSLGQRPSASVAPSPALAHPGLAQLSLRLSTVLTEHDVSLDTQSQLGDAGYVSVSLFAALGHDHPTFIESLKDFGIDPALGTDGPARAKLRLERTRMIAAFDVARVRNDIETRENAQRSATFQVTRISDQDFISARRAFERGHHSLEEEVAPSKPYFERLIAQMSTCYESEDLTTVTTIHQEKEGSAGIGTETDAKGYFRITTKVLAVSSPRSSELYRLRLRTMAYGWCYLRMRFPNVLVLKTITVERFQEFQEYLFGSEVWGMADRGSDGRVTSTPDIEKVKHYEAMIRKDVAKRMNDGQSWWPAMQEATACARLLQVHFLSPVARSSSHSVTAPGIAPYQIVDRIANPKREHEPKPPGGGASANANTQRKKRQRTNQAQKYKALQDSIRNPQAQQAPPKPPQGQLAIADGVGKGAGKAGKPGKGQSRFPAGAHTANQANKGLCIGFNMSNCTRPVCNFAHECWWCLGKHSASLCPQKKIG